MSLTKTAVILLSWQNVARNLVTADMQSVACMRIMDG